MDDLERGGLMMPGARILTFGGLAACFLVVAFGIAKLMGLVPPAKPVERIAGPAMQLSPSELWFEQPGAIWLMARSGDQVPGLALRAAAGCAAPRWISRAAEPMRCTEGKTVEEAVWIASDSTVGARVTCRTAGVESVHDVVGAAVLVALSCDSESPPGS